MATEIQDGCQSCIIHRTSSAVSGLEISVTVLNLGLYVLVNQ